MGNDIPSCFTPELRERETRSYKTNDRENKSNLKNRPYNSLRSNPTMIAQNKFRPGFSLDDDYSVTSTENILTKTISTKSSFNLKKIIKVQSLIRFHIANKKFNEQIELLTNILSLDSVPNLINEEEKNSLLLNNKGEMLSRKLLQEKKIPKFEDTLYYKKNIEKYKPNKFLIKTPLIYIDKYKNKNLYIGTWTLEKNFHGYGIFYISGNKYEGFWNFGKLSGECRYFLQNKDYFIGNFKEGQAFGKGKYFHNDGTIYDGEWLDDQPMGKGTEYFIDGSSFVGIFENGLKKNGKFLWNDGSYYEGDIKNNLFDGKGKFHWKEGREYIGEWKNGKMNGKGVMNYLDGAKYEGDFFNGKREGLGIYTWNKNKYYEGSWVNGKQEGNGYFFNRGKEVRGIWQKGTFVSNFDNGNRISSTSMMNMNLDIKKIFSNDSKFDNIYNNNNISMNYSSNKSMISLVDRKSTNKKINTLKNLNKGNVSGKNQKSNTNSKNKNFKQKIKFGGIEDNNSANRTICSQKTKFNRYAVTEATNKNKKKKK